MKKKYQEGRGNFLSTLKEEVFFFFFFFFWGGIFFNIIINEYSYNYLSLIMGCSRALLSIAGLRLIVSYIILHQVNLCSELV